MQRQRRTAGFDARVTTVRSPEVVLPVETTSVARGAHVCHCPQYVPEDGSEHSDWCATKNVINGSTVHVTAAFGMFLAGLVVQDAVARAEGDETRARPRIWRSWRVSGGEAADQIRQGSDVQAPF